MESGQQRYLKYIYVNMDEAVYKCESTACLYPFRNFKYKNYVDRTIFRYERIMEASALDQKIFTSPTKIESDDMDNFNLSWLDSSFNEDLDSILTTPSDGKTCDIKEIINNICSNGETTSISFNSPPRSGSAQSVKAPAQKLSKCLQYIEHLPAELSHSNKVEAMTSTSRLAQECTLKVATASNNVLKSTSKSLKKIRNGLKKNGEIKPATGLHAVEQKPLGFLDWLDVVSRIEPNQMNEFEFASPTQFSESVDLTNGNENSPDPTYTQPVLIELLRPPASYSLDDNKVSNNSEPCLLYQLDPNELQTTQKKCESMSNDHLETSITTQTSEIRDQILVSPGTPNVEHSSSTDFQIIKTKIGTGSSSSNPGYSKNAKKKERPKAKAQNKNNPDAIDAKLKKKRETKKIEKIKRKREETKKRNKVENIGKTCNAEFGDFHGFEPLEPFIPVTLKRKPLVWLKVE